MTVSPFKLSPAQRRLLAWLGLGLALIALLWLLAPVLSPFVAAAVLAYALDPLVERLAKRMPRVVAVVLVETLAIVLVLALLLLVVPILSKELPLLKAQIPALAARLNQELAPLLQRWGMTASLDVAAIKDFVIRHLGANADDIATALLGSVRIGGSLLLALIGNLVLIPVVLFYLLLDWPQLRERAWALVPPRWREGAREFLGETDTMLGHYLRGQLLVMGVLALYYTLALAIAGFDLALPLGVFTGLAIFVPYVGFGLGLVLTLLAAALQFASWYGLICVALIFGLGQLFESLVLTPRLVGERIGLSPLMVIFVLLAFGHLLGFVGILLALPLSAVGLVGLRRAHAQYLGSGLYRG
ncbi:putative PurR-regulated permease PerM [Inhella inkyongensis]|uniref:Putative PurR-regulated permease PerM n=1 Tax=Inhella inkyongensis TaxID=392593 RepID=A0A840S6P9_9BURK|nr:AI-2E family transporter [Inhella inkyongensis]MBB5206115.1 putative PurR-regulated permease PerM [Inhella inkyongensis]